MTIPDFQSVMVPLLQLMSDRKERRHADLFEELAQHFALSDEERKELLPSGAHPKFENRVRWAKWYLTRAGLLETTSHGVFRISGQGERTLAEAPTVLTIARLKEIGGTGSAEESTVEEVETLETPEERLETSYADLRGAIAQELLDRVKKVSPAFFERLVVDLIVSMGYGGSRRDAGQAIGQAGDGGIDGIIKEDKLGLDVIYIQAKRWENTVGRPVVQAFAGSLEGHHARKGIFITTSGFSKEAEEYVDKIEKKIVLIDGTTLASLMLDHRVGVDTVATYVVQRVDDGFFDEAGGLTAASTVDPPSPGNPA